MTETVRILRIAAGGDGVGRLTDGRTVFIPRTAPGDLVELTHIEIHPAGPTLAVTTVEADNSPFGIRWSGQGLSGFANRFNWAA